jgi:hypothetical protein
MLRRAILVITLGFLIFPLAQAQDLISPIDAKVVAEELIQRNVLYYSVHPERAVNNPEWSRAKPGHPILVHTYPDLKPCYYIVPALNPENEVISLIGISAKEQKWHWYNRVQLERFPEVSQSQAFQVYQRMTHNAETSRPRIVEMPNKRFYWFCSASGKQAQQIFVNIDNASEVHTTVDTDFFKLTTTRQPPEMDLPTLEETSELPENEGRSYPDFYDIEVPFHYQDSSYYCGEASLEIVFDYWGPDIVQDDIGAVANVSPSLGTNHHDMRRACHFSYLSPAVQDSSLHGYNQRPLGYCGNHQRWSFGSHYIDRYDDLRNLISSDYPVIVLTWYSESHYVGHYRVVKGYDDNLDVFVVHDPWYTPPYCGPDFHFNQTFLVDDLWLLVQRWGLFSAPWRVDVVVDSLVGTDQLFTVGAEFEYRGPHPFENQFSADSIQATILLPEGYQLIDPPSATIYFGSQASGYIDNGVWQISAPSNSSGPDTIGFEVKGKVSSSSTSYPSYEDWIGGEGQAMTSTVTYLCGDANGDGEIGPGDVVLLLNYLYRFGSPPCPLVAGDANSDGMVGPGDVVYLINYLFRDGPPPGT